MSDLKIETADEQSAEGWFTVSNTSGGGNAVQIEAIDMGWEWIGEGGARATCGDVDFAWVRRDTGEVVGPGYVIAPNAEITIDYEIVCNDPAPFAVREIKNFAFIELVGRADVFSSSGGLVIATGG